MAYEEDKMYLLSWSGFSTNLSSVFNELLFRKDLVDVTIAVEGQLVKAHRLVLCASSPYFQQMFSRMPASQHAFVFLMDVTHATIKNLIQYMYCGQVNVEQETLPELIKTAKALQIKGLTGFGERSEPAPRIQEQNVQIAPVEDLQITAEPVSQIITQSCSIQGSINVLQAPPVSTHTHTVSTHTIMQGDIYSIVEVDELQPQEEKILPGPVAANEPHGGQNDLLIEIDNPNGSTSSEFMEHDTSSYGSSQASNEKGTNPVVKIEKSKKGNTLVRINGYKFYKVRSASNANVMKYRCRLYSELGCPALCLITKPDNDIDLRDLNHNHGKHTQTARGNKVSKRVQDNSVKDEVETIEIG